MPPTAGRKHVQDSKIYVQPCRDYQVQLLLHKGLQLLPRALRKLRNEGVSNHPAHNDPNRKDQQWVLKNPEWVCQGTTAVFAVSRLQGCNLLAAK